MAKVLTGPEIIQMRVRVNVGLTATQLGLSTRQLRAFEWLLETFKVENIHHGDCVGGDDQLGRKAHNLGYRLVSHPCTIVRKRAYVESSEYRDMKPPLDRNKDIVNETFMLWGFPKGQEELRSGTWSTIRYARKQHKPVLIIYPEGMMEGFFGY